MAGMGKDVDYLGKLQDYYATHKVMPSYQAIADLLGFKSKNAVAALVARLKLLGFIESAPDKRLKPGRRFLNVCWLKVRCKLVCRQLRSTTIATA